MLDCRWLGIGGPGKTTELVLRGVREQPPDGRWVLWGPAAATAALAWPTSEVVPIAADPRLVLGQRHAFRVPAGDRVVFMHQQRPIRPLRATTVIYDTIPLRYSPDCRSRELRRLFLRTIARHASQILTISDYSKASIVQDLGVTPDRVEILRFPFDDAFVERVQTLRASALRTDTALFIGGFLRHKNLPRLLSAFGATTFCRDGGRLVLVGGTPGQARSLLESLDQRQQGFVSVRHSCSQTEIDRLYATSLFLVQPSLEEGFGLPAWEAMCCGLPICVSDGGSLPEVTRGFADPFPARSLAAMIAAIDACADRARSFDHSNSVAQSAILRERAPTVRQFGVQFQAILGDC